MNNDTLIVGQLFIVIRLPVVLLTVQPFGLNIENVILYMFVINE